MARLRIEVLGGAEPGRVLESDDDVVLVGRAPECELSLPVPEISSQHVRLTLSDSGFLAEDLGSVNGTALVRGQERTELNETLPSVALHDGDLLELAAQAGPPTLLRVTFAEAPEPEVVATRSIAELSELPQALDAAIWNDVLRAITRAETLDGVAAAVTEAALCLVARATHATLSLVDEAQAAKTLSPLATRLRGPSGAPVVPRGPVPLTRSVARHVLQGRAAVLAADAPSGSLGSESLLGANIRSTIGVPLWKGNEILGVLQVDNRDAPAMFDQRDVQALGVLAHGASLAIANARLIQRLLAAEEQLRRENQFLRGRERARAGEQRIVGASRALEAALEQVDKVVSTRVTVLIEGETGTGKELFAGAIHYRSPRKDKLFVAQNCAAFPENLLESELFGHKRGAFTGATEEKKGLFEVADGGTLFLDEVGEMPLALQAKLLRVLQEGEIRPIGASSARKVNVRIVAATNRDLEKEVAEGRFREDLFYRLRVFPIRVPPLRERREDIPVLAQHFLERYAREFGRPTSGFSQNALELLARYAWPGNVRELENEIQRAVIEAESELEVTPDMLSTRLRSAAGNAGPAAASEAGSASDETGQGTLREMMDRVERKFLIEILQQHGNNKTSAAKALGITREGLHKKLRAFGL
jgi:Nif-specific regulatory protein